MILRHLVAAAALAGSGLIGGGLVGCGPPPEPIAPPVATASAAPSATPVPATTSAANAPPGEVLPALHPCVPDFIQKDLRACPPGVEPADYSAVANAMAAMAAAGPTGPRPRELKPVPRDLSPLEEKAVSTARAFLCRGGPGDLDDERATAAFDLGRLYLAANHFEEATVILRDVVTLDPEKHAEVEYAARFLLDAARPLAEARPECVAIVKSLVDAALSHVCKGPGADKRGETCAALQ